MIRRSIFVMSVFALVTAACTSGGGGGTSASPSTASSTTPPTATTSPTPTSIALPVSAVRFADLTIVPMVDKEQMPPYQGPATPHSLGGVLIAKQVQKALNASGVSEALVNDGFVIVPAELRLFHFAYQDNVYGGWPVFVTTDVAYHVWHLVFDKVLRSLEQDVLLPKLETLVAGLLKAAHAQTVDVAGSPVADAASRVEQLYQVAAAELGLPVTLGPLAQQEKALIDAHSAEQTSPITGTKVDYSLFTPRGHYTRNEDLTRYFVAMSVLGQLSFCLSGTQDCPGLDPTRLAILASTVLVEDPHLLALWRQIYEPTAFLVGVADDYTPLEVAGAARAAAPEGLGDPTAFADDAVVRDVVDALVGSRPVQIDPERASIRIMGTRFVIDSYILDQLIYPNVGTEQDPRNLPSAVDLAASFGSDFAYGVQEDSGATAYANYDSQLDAMRQAIADRPPQDWGSTVYDAWLYALEPMFAPHDDTFPDFMRTQAWAAKAQQAGLGSYAELKHDTILYTKQAVAEGGDSLPIPPRRNWVEPEPVAFGRLAAVAELLRSGLDDRDLLTREQSGLLRDVEDLFLFFEGLARDELAGAPISDKDNERLTYIGGELESLWWRTSDQTPSGAPSADEDAAVIADIASGPDGVLEIGTGRIDRIYVLVPDDEGTFQVAVGGVYSYYEFTGSSGERLTDEEWRQMLDDGTAPDRPTWAQRIVVGG
jgi:Protein of unknown function (DUF3160)